MIKLLLLTLIIVAIALCLLSVSILIKGRFINMHISGNKAMQQQGVSCATTQDAEARLQNPYSVAEHRTNNA